VTAANPTFAFISGKLLVKEARLMNLELFYALCGDIENRNSSSSVEADQARQLRKDYELYRHSEKSLLPHPVLSSKTIGETQKDSLRRRMADFIAAAL
jgi:hypothetical protein